LKKNNVSYELLAGLKSFFSDKENAEFLKNNEEKFINKLLLFLKNEKTDTAKNQNINDYMVKYRFFM